MKRVERQVTSPGPLDSLQRRYGELLDLCDAVESIIDSISGRMDRTLCIETAARISALTLGPTVELPSPPHRANPRPPADPKLPMDVAAALRSAATERSTFSWQAIDSMLRVFLDGLRRHVAAEQAMLDAMQRSETPH